MCAEFFNFPFVVEWLLYVTYVGRKFFYTALNDWYWRTNSQYCSRKILTTFMYVRVNIYGYIYIYIYVV